MSEKLDKATGQAKEKVGEWTDDDNLKHEGQADQAAGGIKEKIGDAADWAKEKVDDLKESNDKKN